MPVENQFERQLQQKLQGAKMEPRPEAWQQLANRMAADRRRRVIGFWVTTGMAAALLLFALWRFSMPAPEARTPLADVIPPVDTFVITEDDQLALSPPTSVQEGIREASTEVQAEVSAPKQNHTSVLTAPEAMAYNSPQNLEVMPVEVAPPTLLASVSTPPLYVSTQQVEVETQAKNQLTKLEVPEFVIPTSEAHISVGSVDSTSAWNRPKTLAWKASVMPQWQLQDLSLFRTTEVANMQQGVFNNVVTADVTFPILSYSASLAMEYFVSPSFSLEAQAMVINSRQRRNDGFADEAVGFNAQDPRWFEPARFADITYTSMRVPVLMNKYFHMGRSSVILSGGLGWDVVLTSNQDPEKALDSRVATPSAPITNKVPLRNHQFSGIARAHYQYRLGSFAALQMGPTLTHGFLPVFAETNLSDERPLQLGLEVGVKFFPGT